MPTQWSRTMPALLAASDAPSAAEAPALPRLWRGFLLARIFVGGLLLLLPLVGYLLGQAVHPVTVALTVGYFALAVLAARLIRDATFLRSLGTAWITTIGVDIVAFALLQATQSGAINYTPLFALPVLMGAVLGTLRVGLGTTATITLLLLFDALWRWTREAGDPSAWFIQAALTSAGLFVVALLVHELSLRLSRQEILAQRNRHAAQMHARVNELVIETLSEGVLVVDRHGLVHAANPAIADILGHGLASMPLPVALDTSPAWQGLASLARQAFEQRAPQSAEIPIAQQSGGAREIRVITRLTRLTTTGGPRNESVCVMFVQDLRELEARIRTEKLAAMGRMSAAVAHEIRNPLAAISQAAALLEEDLTDDAQRQLASMVLQNARRLASTVDDVLDVARARQQRSSDPSQLIGLDSTARILVEEWVRQTGREGVQLKLNASESEVRFESDHLRRILVNLLDNAARYAGERAGSIEVSTGIGARGQAWLQVWSDGFPLETAVQAHLFEPFFSSESRSSGLGLFICRELCERHGASIGYQRRALSAEGPESPESPEGNAFVVDFAARVANTPAPSQ